MSHDFSTGFADVVAATAPSVVQVCAPRRAASGVVYAPGLVVTTARALGGEERPRVRGSDGQWHEGHVVGFDPDTRLAVVRVETLNATAIRGTSGPARTGQWLLAAARSWSNQITVSAGLVSVIGGPLRTGPRRAIERVIRTSAPMHGGFAGGAALDTDGGLVGITTAASIRGLGVIIPADIALAAAARAIESGSRRQGYLGIAAQSVSVSERQKTAAGRGEGLLVVSVKTGTPAEAAGLLVGDVLLNVDGQAVASPEDLLDLLVGDRVGRTVVLRLLRGDALIEVSATVAERAR